VTADKGNWHEIQPEIGRRRIFILSASLCGCGAAPLR
jgi:hypothetical protein